MKHRPEVDGLRAVAVLSVMLYHARCPGFEGGYVGVDVFFVISGFLITSLVLQEKREGTFSYGEFYERRARRILPALLLVMLATIPLGWLYLLPVDLTDFSRSLVAMSGFGSNVFFWLTGGYFAPTAELRPLLHTWSLAVEEQYYLAYPIFLLGIWGVSGKWAPMVLAAAVTVSLVAAQWGVKNMPSATFYLLPTRAWELLLGGLVAIRGMNSPGNIGTVAGEIGGTVGIALVVAAALLFDASTPFPGLYALIPVLGAALVITFARPETLVGALLSNRVMAYIGLISYSAYLWHYPLFAYARYSSLDEPGGGQFALLVVASLGLAWASWKWVEAPFRDSGRVSRRKFILCVALSSITVMAFGVFGHLTRGFPARLSKELQEVAAASGDRNPRGKECMSNSEHYVLPDQSCILGSGARIIGALLGDSHADTLAHSLEERLRVQGVGMRNLTYSGCPPVKGLYRVDIVDGIGQCERYNDEAFQYVVAHDEIRVVVLSARWTLYLERTFFDNGEGGREFPGREAYVDALDNGVRVRHSEAARRRMVQDHYRQAVESFLKAGKTVILIYPIPEAGWDVPKTVAKSMLRSMSATVPELTTSFSIFEMRNRSASTSLDRIEPHRNLVRIRPADIFCGSFAGGRCVTTFGNKVLYFDRNHLSNAGARLLVDGIMRSMPASTLEN